VITEELEKHIDLVEDGKAEREERLKEVRRLVIIIIYIHICIHAYAPISQAPYLDYTRSAAILTTDL
jgi:hypothetical protein